MVDVCLKVATIFTFITICNGIYFYDDFVEDGFSHQNNFKISPARTPQHKNLKNIAAENQILRFKKYLKDYDYDSQEMFEDTNKQNDNKPSKVTVKPFKSTENSKNRKNSTIRYQYFEVVPAVNYSRHKNIRDSLWYTIENTPCFNLPLLYGHVYPEKFNRNVFSMYQNTIDYVEEPMQYYSGDFTNMTHKITQMRHKSNRWCENVPCFADHTLCMFPKYKMPICGNRYKVKKPNALERVGIINTINSMRNKLANGHSIRYRHLPTAANMQRVLYDRDLERMAERWLLQCVAGPAPCASLDGQMVAELECTKYAKDCCFKTDPSSKCKAKDECYLFSVMGCLYIWYWAAGDKLSRTDVTCGRATPFTYSTVQLFWAKTSKIGCAYAVLENGDERVICNFSPSSSFSIESRLYCGILLYHDNKTFVGITQDLFSTILRLHWRYSKNDYTFSLLKLRSNASIADPTYWKRKKYDTIKNFVSLFKHEKAREYYGDWTNGTRSWMSVQVAKHKFVGKSGPRCESGERVYRAGKPGSLCDEHGRLYYSLCDAFQDPTPGYRLITLVAAIVLFSLVLCDLFSGVVRQNNF
ncbi:uncharacterized protein LOC121728331 [Aricia agestis]|uniref:uncharacterized protein LOC121728331 n=1 Tax=Aricia agestis TaxID=91739 RepID=UPI001C208E0F|nr:uncharacterized protein LOC121728331 [Aricia agestis]